MAGVNSEHSEQLAGDPASCQVVFKSAGVHVNAAPGRILLEVAEEAGVSIPSLCRGGTCGTCKVILLSGAPEIGTRYALNAEERRAGWILSCSARTVAGARIELEA